MEIYLYQTQGEVFDMTVQELGALYEIHGPEVQYDARVQGYHVTLPMKIISAPKSNSYLLQRADSDYYFSASEIVDMKKL